MLRAAAPQHAATLAELHVRCWQETYAGIIPQSFLDGMKGEQRLPVWQTILAAPDRFVRVVGKEPLGFIVSGPRRDDLPVYADGEVYSVYLLRKAQGAGFGRAMMASAARDWRDRGGQSMQVSVASQNEPARRFYERLGGVAVGEGQFQIDCQNVPETIYLFRDLESLTKA